jgi:hypothetical protein
MKDHRLTARVSPALHELAHNLGGQSAGLRAALLIAAASLDYDMRLYKDDVRGVLSDELAPEVAEAVQSIYLAVCAPPVCQAEPKRQPRGEHPVPPPVTEQSPDEPVTQRVADPLQDVGIAV